MSPFLLSFNVFSNHFIIIMYLGLASVMIPGVIINMIVKASRFAVARASLPVTVAKWLPIPYVVHPIDESVDLLLDSTARSLISGDGTVLDDWLLSDSSQATTTYFKSDKPPRGA